MRYKCVLLLLLLLLLLVPCIFPFHRHWGLSKGLQGIQVGGGARGDPPNAPP